MFKIVLFAILIFSIFLFLYNYFIYPLAVYFLSSRREDAHDSKVMSVKELTEFPSVSFIIAAYNEEKVIREKIENTFSIDYPTEKFEFIIVSDGSSDSTPKIVEEFSDSIIGLFEVKRGGKSAALNRAVEKAAGEILVFSDANNDFSVDAVKQLVRHFEDTDVGAVTGAKHIYDSSEREASTGDGLYWKYESRIKKSESKLGSITAAEGEILAVRKSLYIPIDSIKVNDDAAITFDLIKAGYRVLYEENARSSELASIDLVDDIKVKIRMTFGGFQTMSMERDFLFPPTTWFSFNFISHKVLRWFTPHFMISIFVSSLMLWETPVVTIFLIGQTLFYFLAYLGWIRRKNTNISTLIYIPMYFTVMNIALFIGFLRYLKDSSKVKWEKAER